jgi:CheY-like chemotaxis protein
MAIKVLLADDSITIQKVIGIIFGSAEYTLTVVDNGTAAVEKAREQLPDVLLIDVNMPGLNGYKTCEAIRAIPALAEKPILLLIGSFEPFDEEKAKMAGADDFITKPFESQHIISKVNDLYEAAAARTAPIPTVDDYAGFPDISEHAFNDTPGDTSTMAIDDIWGAFTSAADISEDSPEPALDIATDGGIFSDFGFQETEPTGPVAAATSLAPVQAAEIPAASQWDDLDLNSIETAPDAPAAVFSNPPAVDSPFDENAFDFSYREISSQPSEPESPSTPPIEPKDSVAAACTLTEDQLKAAISAVSKEVIERIVWEVVPDLAENIIKETIRRIREGK